MVDDLEFKCNSCFCYKVSDSFYNQIRNNSVYRNPKCKDCCRANARKYSKTIDSYEKRKIRYELIKNDENFISNRVRISKKHYNSLLGRAKSLLKTSKRSSSKFDCESDLDLDFIVNKLKVGICEVTGLLFCYENKFNTSKNPMSPSLDRIDSNLGYTKENTRMVIWQYNLMKGELSDHELFKIFGDFFKKGLKNDSD